MTSAAMRSSISLPRRWETSRTRSFSRRPLGPSVPLSWPPWPGSMTTRLILRPRARMREFCPELVWRAALGNVQDEVLFEEAFGAFGAVIVAAVAGVDDHAVDFEAKGADERVLSGAGVAGGAGKRPGRGPFRGGLWGLRCRYRGRRGRGR